MKRRYRGDNSIMDDLASRFNRSLDTEPRVKIYIEIPEKKKKGIT